MEEILSESQGKILLVPKLSSHGIYNGCKHFNIFSKLFYGNGGHWGQEVIFKVAEAKFGNSSSFRRFSLENFHWFRFRGCWTSGNSATLEGAQEILSKNTFLKSVHSMEKDETCLDFIQEIFTKSVHRAGV